MRRQTPANQARSCWISNGDGVAGISLYCRGVGFGLIEESNRSDFDALPGWRIGQTGGILKRCVGHKPGTPIRFGVVAFEQKYFVRVHQGIVVPALFGVGTKGVDLAGSVAISERRSDKILALH